ncbi:hypothetical protein J437_LFUL016071 [Ladona fulva]|uniref:Uncharacterized protein n=1 Tax=Ladona fulva TaxID=123851 RepID=A0A8K0KM23_LADFU|nr:hypothetical protein J437_LFUL016071 [Ladona fulva]
MKDAVWPPFSTELLWMKSPSTSALMTPTAHHDRNRGAHGSEQRPEENSRDASVDSHRIQNESLNNVLWQITPKVHHSGSPLPQYCVTMSSFFFWREACRFGVDVRDAAEVFISLISSLPDKLTFTSESPMLTFMLLSAFSPVLSKSESESVSILLFPSNLSLLQLPSSLDIVLSVSMVASAAFSVGSSLIHFFNGSVNALSSLAGLLHVFSADSSPGDSNVRHITSSSSTGSADISFLGGVAEELHNVSLFFTSKLTFSFASDKSIISGGVFSIRKFFETLASVSSIILRFFDADETPTGEITWNGKRAENKASLLY